MFILTKLKNYAIVRISTLKSFSKLIISEFFIFFELSVIKLNEKELQMNESCGKTGKKDQIIEDLKKQIIELKKKNKELELTALTDPLTGLGNRTRFDQSMESEIARARRYGHKLQLLMIDLDGFKKVNDDLGHAEGDAVLKELAYRLEYITRETDIVSRWGGDEFTIILTETESSEVNDLIRRLILETEHMKVDRNLHEGFGISIGSISWKNESFEELCELADKEMYRIKNEKKTS